MRPNCFQIPCNVVCNVQSRLTQTSSNVRANAVTAILKFAIFTTYFRLPKQKILFLFANMPQIPKNSSPSNLRTLVLYVTLVTGLSFGSNDLMFFFLS